MSVEQAEFPLHRDVLIILRIYDFLHCKYHRDSCTLPSPNCHLININKSKFSTDLSAFQSCNLHFRTPCIHMCQGTNIDVKADLFAVYLSLTPLFYQIYYFVNKPFCCFTKLSPLYFGPALTNILVNISKIRIPTAASIDSEGGI